MKSTKKKIKYGKLDVLSEDEFTPKYAKFRMTMYVDLDVLDEIRKRAASRGLPYQTYINQLLRDTVLGSVVDERIRSIVRAKSWLRSAPERSR